MRQLRPAALSIAASLLLAGALLTLAARGQTGDAAVPSAATISTPLYAFVDSAGRRIALPASINRVLPAERNAEVLLYVLAPGKLMRPARPGYDWSLAANPAPLAALAREAGVDLILDAGPVTPARAAFADQVQRLSGIPYILANDSFSRMPEMLRAIGGVLGDDNRGDRLARYADHAISGIRGRLLITPADNRPRVYFALGPDGLITALPGSPAEMALEEAGVINVAAAAGRGGLISVSPGQLLAWNPDYIIAEDRAAYDEFRRDPQWRSLAAVERRQVFLEPTRPFGWIEDPSSVNRLIGLGWLSTLFYPATTAGDLRTTVCEFYDLFYRTKLTNAQIEAMVRPAGVPPPENPAAMQEPMGRIGPAMPVPQTSPAPGAPTAAAPNPAAPAGQSPSAITGVPGLPNTAPTAACTVPTAPTPLPLPGLAPVPGVPTPPGGAPVPRT